MERVSLKQRCGAFAVAGILALSCAWLTACAGSSDSGEADSGATETQQAQQADDQATTRIVTVDGTDYEIPQQVDKVAPTIGALAQIAEMVSTDGDNIAATSIAQIGDRFKEVFPGYEQGNPNGYDTSDIESVIESGAQVVYGPRAMYTDEQLQQLTDAGVVFIPMNNLATIDGICSTTEAIGEILGGESAEKAKAFSQYWKANIEDCQNRTASITDKPTVLNLSYNNGAWSTEARAALISEYIEAVGGQSLSADCTAQGEGALMADWIGTEINPDAFADVDMVKMTQDFFKDWYGVDLSEDDANAVLNATY